MKRLNLILSALLVIMMIACSCATVFAAGDVSSAIESTWNDAKSQIQNVVNNVVFPINIKEKRIIIEPGRCGQTRRCHKL